ncbi:MAG TPA: hypothetical protein VIJ68_03070 [Candidatus Saccharimonadales bacterium]
MFKNIFRRFGSKQAPVQSANPPTGPAPNPTIAPGSSSDQASSLAPPMTLPDDVNNALLTRPEPPQPDSLVRPIGPGQPRPNPQTIQAPQDPEKPA